MAGRRSTGGIARDASTSLLHISGLWCRPLSARAKPARLSPAPATPGVVGRAGVGGAGRASPGHLACNSLDGGPLVAARLDGSVGQRAVVLRTAVEADLSSGGAHKPGLQRMVVHDHLAVVLAAAAKAHRRRCEPRPRVGAPEDEATGRSLPLRSDRTAVVRAGPRTAFRAPATPRRRAAAPPGTRQGRARGTSRAPPPHTPRRA